MATDREKAVLLARCKIGCSYRALGLELGATQEEIRRARKDVLPVVHPDKNLDDKESAAEAFIGECAGTADLQTWLRCFR